MLELSRMVEFTADSPLEERGFEPLVPAKREDAFGTATLPDWDRLEPHLRRPEKDRGSNPFSSASEAV